MKYNVQDFMVLFQIHVLYGTWVEVNVKTTQKHTLSNILHRQLVQKPLHLICLSICSYTALWLLMLRPCLAYTCPRKGSKWNKHISSFSQKKKKKKLTDTFSHTLVQPTHIGSPTLVQSCAHHFEIYLAQALSSLIGRFLNPTRLSWGLSACCLSLCLASSLLSFA